MFEDNEDVQRAVQLIAQSAEAEKQAEIDTKAQDRQADIDKEKAKAEIKSQSLLKQVPQK